MEHDWLVERHLRERSKRLWLHGTSRELNRSGPGEVREDAEDGAKPQHDGVAGWVHRAATEITVANAKLDALGVARSAPDADVDYTLAERIQMLADPSAPRR
ncbi:hypothetical protein [Leptospira sp. id769339]|uniref:hypothetical protein n=1 Tax=Leptospira sp. id769339 TaxID=2864221 RepID=UPI00214C3EE7|nr:hypothetical protein [Leptospira sp. id769339]MCR1795933.1 hypothetical protein [Leptospira sp. id769339]